MTIYDTRQRMNTYDYMSKHEKDSKTKFIN